MLGEDPADGARALEGAAGHRAAVRLRRQPADRAARWCRAQASYYADPRDPDEVLELVGLTEKAGVARPVAVRWAAAPARRRPGHRRPADPAVPRRADHRLRPRGPPAVLVADPLAARARHHDAAHHPLPGRGRGAGRPGRRHRPRPAGRGRRPGAARRPGDRARPSVSWTEDGARRTEATATPTAFVRDLAARFPGEVPDLAVARPTLEDVYLRMIGEPDDGDRPRARGGALPSLAARLPLARRRWSSRSSSGSASRWSSRCCCRCCCSWSSGRCSTSTSAAASPSPSTSWPGSSPPASSAPACRTWRSASPPSAPTGRSRAWPARRCRKSAYFVGKIVQVLAVTRG